MIVAPTRWTGILPAYAVPTAWSNVARRPEGEDV